MNKQQKEVLQTQLSEEEKTLKWLKQVYEQASKDTADKIAQLSARTDMENLQSIIYQKKYQEALKKQIDDALKNLDTKTYAGISDYMNKCYENGYVGAMYDLHAQGIPIISPIDQKQVVNALRIDSKISQGLYSRLGEDVDKLKMSIKAEVSRGIVEGKSYNDVAKSIAKGMNSPFNTALHNAQRIARTEGHRVQIQGQNDALHNAKEKGADIVKQWDATLDDRTRESHQLVDGEIRELDEEFSNGLMYPSDPSGDACEVINCRCALLQRARWNLDTDFTKHDGFTDEIREFNSPKDYDEFKEWYFSDENMEYMKYYKDLEEKYGTKDPEKLMEEMTDAEYKKFHDLESNSPMWNFENKDLNVSTIESMEHVIQYEQETFDHISQKYNIISGNRGKEKIFPREERAIEESINFIQSNFGDVSDIVENIQVRKNILGQSNVTGLYDKVGEYYKKPNTIYVQHLSDAETLTHEFIHAISSEIAIHYEQFGFTSRNKFMDAMESEAYSLSGESVPKRTNDLTHYDRRNSDEFFSVTCERDFSEQNNENHTESNALTILKKYWELIGR